MSKIYVKKRNGKMEEFQPNTKMRRAILWACDGNETYCDILMNDAETTVVTGMFIEDVFNNYLTVARSKVSRLQPVWATIAAKLYTLTWYKNGVVDSGPDNYPPMTVILNLGIEAGIYDPSLLSSYSQEDMIEIEKTIIPENDLSFTIDGIESYTKKYCKPITIANTKYNLEYPQHTMMRIAMGLFALAEDGDHKYPRIEMVKRFYRIISSYYVTVSTPIATNTGTIDGQSSSCILNTIGNSTNDLMNKLITTGIYTKFSGGIAIDVSRVASKGSLTKRGVVSGGIVPHIQNIQQVVNSLMQSDTRRGSAVITCTWWHADIEYFLELKDAASGTPDTRALDLKYTLATNDYLYRMMETDGVVYLFNPADTPLLNELYGQEWEDAYHKYVAQGIYTEEIRSRSTIFDLFLKHMYGTGNIYEILLDNVNNQSILNRYVGSSNLCSEILQPSRPMESLGYTIDPDDDSIIHKHEQGEEIALCNLMSFNVMILDLPKTEFEDIIYVTSAALDCSIDTSYYPIGAAEVPNKKYRYIGLGQCNTARYFAEHQMKMDAPESHEFTFLYQQKLALAIIDANTQLAETRGHCNGMSTSQWKDGVMPYDLSNELLREQFEHLVDEEEYERVRERAIRFGVRNILMTAIAPTASSATSVGLTESIEPVHALEYQIDGAIQLTVLVPEVQRLGQHYSLAYDMNQERLIVNNCIRQMWMQQSQAFNIYLTDQVDYDELYRLKRLAHQLGMNTWYYTNSKKTEAIIKESDCTNCQ